MATDATPVRLVEQRFRMRQVGGRVRLRHSLFTGSLALIIPTHAWFAFEMRLAGFFPSMVCNLPPAGLTSFHLTAVPFITLFRISCFTLFVSIGELWCRVENRCLCSTTGLEMVAGGGSSQWGPSKEENLLAGC